MGAPLLAGYLAARALTCALLGAVLMAVGEPAMATVAAGIGFAELAAAVAVGRSS